jgi:hypothetical protein
MRTHVDAYVYILVIFVRSIYTSIGILNKFLTQKKKEKKEKKILNKLDLRNNGL